ncbi:hypothetical protein [Hymenobacter properus]|uniref:Uncharacterized protein n=1 Tax=Hymenobacter properus TaxID=2791026 RepID=A0A931BNN0_9BACT|nr:hypothetical protein [Hymenobacter properus]MBF9142750.1 hypothetical protein [Hymenobacter properus]MBR7721558.1 hypothetical protein [Microvirga sp. SRT04]
MKPHAPGRWLPAVAVVAALLPAPTLAQKLALEKTHDVSGKAKRGFLDDVKIDEPTNKVDLVFCTKANNRKVKFETYHFDKQFNFKGMDESEEPVEKVKRYKGDLYDVLGVTVEPNMMGTLVLRRKQVHYKWDWVWGGYNKKVEILEKVKPRGDNGAYYQYLAHADYDQTGTVVVLTSVKDKLGKGMDPMKMYKEFHVLKFNKDLDLVADTPLNFDKPMSVVEAKKLDPQGDRDEDADDSADPEYDLGFVFAPSPVGGKKTADAPTNYAFVRVGADTKERARVALPSPNGAWLVNGMAQSADGTLSIFGPANDKADEYFAKYIPSQAANGGNREPEEEAFKAKNFQLAQIKDGAVRFVTSTPIDEFEKKLQTPPAQKRTPEYTGKRFKVTGGSILPNGDLLIQGQAFKFERKGLIGGAPKTASSGGGLAGGLMSLAGKGGTTMSTTETLKDYRDVMMFHFDNKGQLRAQYGVRRQENNKYSEQNPNEQHTYLGQDGRSVYWMIGEISGVRELSGMESGTAKVLYYPAVAKIDLASAKLSNFAKFGNEQYFLNNSMPQLPMGGKNSIVYFGENKSGKTMWFGQMPLE